MSVDDRPARAAEPSASSRTRELAAPIAAWLAVMLGYQIAVAGLLPNARGEVGHDYAYYLPRLLAGVHWFDVNGPFAMPWFSPAFGAGLPFYPNPGSVYVSLPQALSFVVDPLTAARWTMLAFATIGFAGMWTLARRSLGASSPAACLGAIAFAFNGYFVTRSVVGHLAYHSVMLLPAIAHFVIAPLPGDRRARAWRIVRDACLAGIAAAYVLQSGNVYGVAPAAIAVVAFACWSARDLAACVARAALAFAIALALCAAKLAAAAAYLGSFPRSGYPLPGARDPLAAIELAGRALFLDPPVERARELFVGQRYALGAHEWDFGLTWVALAAIALGAAVEVARRARARRISASGALRAAVFAAMLAIPLAVNVHGEAWTAWLKSLPGLESSSALVRWWFAYVPIAAAAAAWGIDRIAGSKARASIAAVACALVVAMQVFDDRSELLTPPYSPAAIVEAWRNRGDAPAIVAIATSPTQDGRPLLMLGRDDAIARGESQLSTYEPLFGYALEWFPSTFVRAGPALDVEGGKLNLHDPAAFLFSRERGRAPGSRLRVGEEEQAKRFLAYGPFECAWPPLQLAARALNVVALIAVAALLAFALARRR